MPSSSVGKGFSVVEHVNFYPRGTSCAEDVKKAEDIVYPAAMHFKLLTILALICSPVALAGVPLSYNPAYDNGATSINAVACSDGLNGLGTRGYKTLGSLPHFPYIGGAPAIESWNSTNCGSCWQLFYFNNSIPLLAVDKGNGQFIASEKAMNILTDGHAVEFGTINIAAVRVSPSECGL